MNKITKLKPNQIFVFGSNLNGHHIGGAARQAFDDFGAVWGLGIGIQGQSYAIPTLGYEMEKLPLEEIKYNLEQLVEYTKENPHQEFLLTKIGQGIAGFSAKEIESIIPVLPDNITRI